LTSNIFGQQSLIKKKGKRRNRESAYTTPENVCLIYTKCKFVDTKKKEQVEDTHTHTKNSVSMHIHQKYNKLFFFFVSHRVSANTKKTTK
jgi:hypothetical protein